MWRLLQTCGAVVHRQWPPAAHAEVALPSALLGHWQRRRPLPGAAAAAASVCEQVVLAAA